MGLKPFCLNITFSTFMLHFIAGFQLVHTTHKRVVTESRKHFQLFYNLSETFGPTTNIYNYAVSARIWENILSGYCQQVFSTGSLSNTTLLMSVTHSIPTFLLSHPPYTSGFCLKCLRLMMYYYIILPACLSHWSNQYPVKQLLHVDD